MPEILQTINRLGVQAKNSDADKVLKSKIAMQVKMINSKLQPKQKELQGLIEDLYLREGKIARKLSSVAIK